MQKTMLLLSVLLASLAANAAGMHQAQLWYCGDSSQDAIQAFVFDNSTGYIRLEGSNLVLRNVTSSELPSGAYAPPTGQPFSQTVVAAPAVPEASPFAAQRWRRTGNPDSSVQFEALEADGTPSGSCLGARMTDSPFDLFFLPEGPYSLKGYPGTKLRVVPCSSWDLQGWKEDGNRLKYPGFFDPYQNQTLCVDITSSLNCSSPSLKSYPYCDASQSPSARAKDAVSRMSTTELVMNMGAGYSLAPTGSPRLGIRPLAISEGAHGAFSGCAGSCPSGDANGCPTVYPTVPNLGATFNRSLWAAITQSITVETRALYNQNTTCAMGTACASLGRQSGIYLFAPNHNIARNPFWGRTQEVASEDVKMTSEYAKIVLENLGAERNGIKGAIGTSKHYVAYDFDNSSVLVTDRYMVTVNLTSQDLAAFYLPAFKAAVKEAKAPTVMCSYNAYSIDGGPSIPSCANKDMLSLLYDRYDLGEGIVISDQFAILFFGGLGHGYTPDDASSALAAVEAGVNVDTGILFSMEMQGLLDKGKVSREDLEPSATKTLALAAQLGLMDPTTPWDDLGPCDVGTKANAQLALEAAEQSITLLKNSAQKTLPLSTTKSLAVVGPWAAETWGNLGNYNGSNVEVEKQSVLQGLQRQFNKVSYAKGAEIDGNDTSGIAAAVEIAEDADVVVLVLAGEWNGEMMDRSRLGLNEGQIALAQAMVNTSKPMVVLEMGCSMLTLPDFLVHGSPSVSIVWAYCPGIMTGDAVANVLSGKVSPSGRLPVSIYPTTYGSRLPYNTSLEDATYAWWTSSSTSRYGPLQFTFGHGLSYANHSVSSVSPSSSSISSSSICSGSTTATSLTVSILRSSSDNYRLPAYFTALAQIKFPASAEGAPPNPILVGFNRTQTLPDGKPTQITIDLDLRYLIRPSSSSSSSSSPSSGVSLPDGVLTPGMYTVQIGGPEHWATATIEITGSSPCTVSSSADHLIW